MARIPPLLPHETFVRVIRLAKLDGIGVLLVASFFAVLFALAGDMSGALVGLLVAGAGAIELHGVSLLQRSDARGMRWLIGSQLFLLFTILAYCAVRLTHVEIPPVPELAASVIDLSAAQWNMTREEYLLFVQKLALRLLAGLSILYQGGMAFYYYYRRDVVRRALAED